MEENFFHTSSRSPKSKKAIAGALVLLAVVGAVGAYMVLSPSPLSHIQTMASLEDMEFEEFVQRFSKEYVHPLEYQARQRIFNDNAGFIRAFNKGYSTYKLAINKFADLTFPEFKNLYLPYKFPQTNAEEPSEKTPLLFDNDSIDWRKKGAVTNVKNQGACGSCWAFSTVEGVEGSWALAGNKLESFSEQQLVDCSRTYGNEGCNGGLMYLGYDYVLDHGLTSYKNYPYHGKDGKCKDDKVKQKVATIKSYQNVTSSDENALLNAANQGPVSVAVEADQMAWQFYFSGIVSDECGTKLDHGVLVVGYDKSGETPYWIVKNSWGADWGEKGYIRIKISSGKGVCGINMQPSIPTS